MRRKFNLIGNTFSHLTGGNRGYSVHGKESRLVEWVKDGSGEATFYVDNALERVFANAPNGPKYGWLTESRQITPRIVNEVKARPERYLAAVDAIFTHNRELLQIDDRFKWVPAQGFWIENPKIYAKTKLISMIASDKNKCAGHRRRLEWVEKLKGRVDLYGRGFHEIARKEEGLCDYMFSVAIENDCYRTYFTEKLLDCFATGTIPVYLGAPDVGEHFNRDGIIDLAEGFDVSEELYHSRTAAILDNLERVRLLEIPEDFIATAYLKLGHPPTIPRMSAPTMPPPPPPPDQGVPPPPQVKRRMLRHLLAKHSIRYFLETGTHLGETTAAIAPWVERAETIELGDALFARARDRFQNTFRVKCHHGDSGEILGRVLAGFDTPVLLWLDGHYSGKGTALGPEVSPLWRELEHVRADSHAAGHVLLIDDVRLFGTAGYPRLAEVLDWLASELPGHVASVHRDMLVVEPRRPLSGKDHVASDMDLAFGPREPRENDIPANPPRLRLPLLTGCGPVISESRIVHRVSLSTEPSAPHVSLAGQETGFPGWETRWWGERDLGELVPHCICGELLLDRRLGLDFRTKVLRFELLRCFGGAVVESGFEMLRPLDEIMVEDCVHAGLVGDRILGDGLLVSPAGHPFWEFMLRRILARARRGGDCGALTRLAGAAALTEACGLWLADQWEAQPIVVADQVVGGILDHGDWVLWTPDVLNADSARTGRSAARFNPYGVMHETASAALEFPRSCGHTALQDGKAPEILIGVCSCVSHAAHRNAVRETWAATPGPTQTVRFFLGADHDLAGEPDTVCLPVDDSYAFLPAKVMAFFRHALANFDFDWLFKCDDDTYVDLTRLAALAEAGCDLVGNDFLTSRGFPSGGAGYLLSRAMVERLAARGKVPDQGQEDVLIGQESVRLGARTHASKRLVFNTARLPRAGNDVVTAHWCPPRRLRAVHTIRHSSPEREIEVFHPHWHDRLALFGDGTFVRRSVDGAGFFHTEGDDIVIEWFGRGCERLAPGRTPRQDPSMNMEVAIRQGVASVTVELMGRMGNQMFQYAHGLALAKAAGAKLRVVMRAGPWRFALGDFGIAIDEGIPKGACRIGFPESQRLTGAWPAAQAINKSDATDFVVAGYFQNEGYFLPVAEQVRRMFRLPDPPVVAPPGFVPVCVHVRRGDFVGNAIHDICTPGYFLNAVTLMARLDPLHWFVVLSDDPEWCNEVFGGTPNLDVLPLMESGVAFRTMLGCKAFVLSNSTFGWWAAWLAASGPVIAPDRWVRGKDWNICPSRWLQLTEEGIQQFHPVPKSQVP